jgi:hypothetical protein
MSYCGWYNIVLAGFHTDGAGAQRRESGDLRRHYDGIQQFLPPAKKRQISDFFFSSRHIGWWIPPICWWRGLWP